MINELLQMAKPPATRKHRNAVELLRSRGGEDLGCRSCRKSFPPALHPRPRSGLVWSGLVWGVWHVPLYGPAGFVVPWVLAIFYTVLWNATRSVGLCILLHASFTPAQDYLILLPGEAAYTPVLDTPDWVILGTYATAAVVLVIVTRGRLGAERADQAS